MALAAEFPPADRDDWLALAGDVERLRTTTYDGITIEPLYTAADAVADAGLPGPLPVRARPHGRGHTRRLGRPPGRRRQRRPGRRRRRARARRDVGVGRSSATAPSVDEPSLRRRLLDGVLLDVAPVVLDAGRRWVDAARALRSIWRRTGVDPAAVRGSFGADPFGDWAFDRDVSRLDTDLGVAARRGARPSSPSTRTCAWRRSTAPASTMPERPMPRSSATPSPSSSPRSGRSPTADSTSMPRSPRSKLRLAATVDQFATIAKFRAARRLLARVAEVAGVPDAAGHVPLHAVTSRAMATRYDAVGQHRARDDRLLLGGSRRRRRHHRAPPRRPRPPVGERARQATRPQHPVGARAGVQRRQGDRPGRRVVVRRAPHRRARRTGVGRLPGDRGGRRLPRRRRAGLVDDRIAAARAARAADVDHRTSADHRGQRVPERGRRRLARRRRRRRQPAHRWAAGFEALRLRVDAAAAATDDGRPCSSPALGTPAASATGRRQRSQLLRHRRPRHSAWHPTGADVGSDVAALAARSDDAARCVDGICAATDVADALVAASDRVAGADRGSPAPTLCRRLDELGRDASRHASPDLLATRRLAGPIDGAETSPGDARGRRRRASTSPPSTRPPTLPASTSSRHLPRHRPVPPRPVPDDVRHPAVDDPPVRRLLHGHGVQRLLPPQPRRRPEGAVRRLRPGDPPRLRQRPPPRRRRRRDGRRGDRLDPRHAPAVRPHPARPDQRVDDDERGGAPGDGALRGGRRGAGRAGGQARRDDPERHPQGVHGPQHVHLPTGTVDGDRRRTSSPSPPPRCPSSTRSRSPATTCRRPGRRRISSSPTRSPTASSTSAPD